MGRRNRRTPRRRSNMRSGGSIRESVTFSFQSGSKNVTPSDFKLPARPLRVNNVRAELVTNENTIVQIGVIGSEGLISNLSLPRPVANGGKAISVTVRNPDRFFWDPDTSKAIVTIFNTNTSATVVGTLVVSFDLQNELATVVS